MAVLGFDVGGAHLKVGRRWMRPGGCRACRFPAPCGRGWSSWMRAFAEALDRELAPSELHGVTMTGELCRHLSRPRRGGGAGCATIPMLAHFPAGDLRFYGGEAGFVAPAEATAAAAERSPRPTGMPRRRSRPSATTRRALRRHGARPRRTSSRSSAGRVIRAGSSDAARMRRGELVYTGATRTFLMAVAQQCAVPRAAPAGDGRVFRVHGGRPSPDLASSRRRGQHATADGAGKTPGSVAARLARMIGRDLAEAESGSGDSLAGISPKRSSGSCRTPDRRCSRAELLPEARRSSRPASAASCGRVARRLARPYGDFAGLMQGDPASREWAARARPPPPSRDW